MEEEEREVEESMRAGVAAEVVSSSPTQLSPWHVPESVLKPSSIVMKRTVVTEL